MSERQDIGAIWIGSAFIAIGVFQPWPVENADIVIGFGTGLGFPAAMRFLIANFWKSWQ